MTYLMQNLGTIVISAVLLAIVVLIVLRLMKNKKAGTSSCGCNCAHCALHGTCHKAAKK